LIFTLRRDLQMKRISRQAKPLSKLNLQTPILLALTFALVVVPAVAQTITAFDAPGAGTGINQGTLPYGINAAGVITGHYLDSGSVHHGFVRATNGTITTFKVRGAGTSVGQGTFARGLNASGVIAGYYADSGSVNHGFVRAKNHTITVFDAPGAGTGAFQGTDALHINAAGTIVGTFAD
jgi:hypothetical protein